MEQTHQRMTVVLMAIGVSVTALVFLFVIYMMPKRPQTTTENTVYGSPTEMPIETEALPTDVASPSADTDVPVPVGWQQYQNPAFGFSLYYPADIQIADRGPEGIQAFKLGPTQKGQTEMYDGINVSIKTGSRTGDLMTFVQSEQTRIKTEPSTIEVGEISQRTIGPYTGYQFTVRTIGDGTYLYLPKGPDGYYRVVDGTLDPSNAGFAAIVKTMISTLKSL